MGKQPARILNKFFLHRAFASLCSWVCFLCMWFEPFLLRRCDTFQVENRRPSCGATAKVRDLALWSFICTECIESTEFCRRNEFFQLNEQALGQKTQTGPMESMCRSRHAHTRLLAGTGKFSMSEKERPPDAIQTCALWKIWRDFLGNSLTSKSPTCWKSWGWSQWNCGSPYVCGQPLDANKHVWCLELEGCLLEVHVIKSSSKRTRLLRQVSESWPVWDGSSEVEFALGSWDAACTPAYYTAIRFS